MTGGRPLDGAGELGATSRLLGTTALEGADGGPVPTTFRAVTVKVYEVPLVRPKTTAAVALPPATAVPPGVPVIV